MLPDSIRLWKNDRDVWRYYAPIFKLRNHSNQDLFIQQIARLVRQGWTPYDAKLKKVNGDTQCIDFDFSGIDTAPLEIYLKNLDPVTHYAGEAIRDWLIHRKKDSSIKKGSIIIAPLEQTENEKALSRATTDYLAGRFVPKCMIQKVISRLSSQRNR